MGSVSVEGSLRAGLSSDLEGSSPRALLEWGLGLRPESFLRRTPTRETFLVPGREGWVVKRSVGAGDHKDWWFERLRGTRRSPTCETPRSASSGSRP